MFYPVTIAVDCKSLSDKSYLDVILSEAKDLLLLRSQLTRILIYTNTKMI